MQCRNHPEENGVNTCNQCGSWICESCSYERGGRIFCPNCVSQHTAVGTSASEIYKPTVSHVHKTISWGMLFLFSVIIPLPGLNYMYMGFIKRGLVAMSAFFGTIYFVTQFSGFGNLILPFVFAIPVLWLTCTFDGFRMRARINAGEVITDNIDDITAFAHRNRFVLISLLLLLVAINVIGGIMPWLVRILRHAIPILIALLAVQVLFRKP